MWPSAAFAKEIFRRKLFAEREEFNDGEVVSESKKEALSTVKCLLERTILSSEGNSLLIIGPRGCGKSWLLHKVFKDLDSNKHCKNNYIRVYLNGLVHTDDRLALLDIAQQLDVEEELGDRVSISFAAALTYMLEALRNGDHSNQSIIFVLDEFDLFAQHKNQTLLYNLLDTSQSAHNPIAVVGLTCRQDVVELLEKRVKSRFSHRQILLFPHTDFQDYLGLCKSLLSLPTNFEDSSYKEAWQKHLKALFENSATVKVLRRLFDMTADVRSLKSLLLLPVSRLSISSPFLIPSDFSRSYHILYSDSSAVMLAGLSVLELCLVIAAKNLTQLSGGEPFNFEMVYSEYNKFTQRTKSLEVFSKPVALKAFDHLLSLEIVVPLDASATGYHGQRQQRLREYQSLQLLLTEEQVSTAVCRYHNCPTEVTRWATSQATA